MINLLNILIGLLLSILKINPLIVKIINYQLHKSKRVYKIYSFRKMNILNKLH